MKNEGFKFTMNGTLVAVEVVDGKTVVSVNTEDADVVINGETIWSKYDKEEYKYIPVKLRPFVEKHSSYIGLSHDKKNAEVDLHLPDIRTQLTLYIPQNSRKAMHCRTDYINSLEDLKDEYLLNNSNISEEKAEELLAYFTGLENDIQEKAKEFGYRFVPSHSMDEFVYAWWDIVTTVSNFDESNILELMKLVDIFNLELKKILNEYGE